MKIFITQIKTVKWYKQCLSNGVKLYFFYVYLLNKLNM